MVSKGNDDRNEDISRRHNLGYDVDDNNMPASENIPNLPDEEVTTTVIGLIC